MDKTEALLKHMRDVANWLEIRAREFENGDARHFQDGADDSSSTAADYRHKLGNIVAVLQAYNRLKAAESIHKSS